MDGQSIQEYDKNAMKKMINDDKERLVGGSIPENVTYSYKDENNARRQAKNELLADSIYTFIQLMIRKSSLS